MAVQLTHLPGFESNTHPLTPGLTKGQRGQAVGGHGQLVKAVQLAELAREAAQVVAVGRQALQGQALVQPLGQRAQQVHGHVQSLQLTQLPDLCRVGTQHVKNKNKYIKTYPFTHLQTHTETLVTHM